MRVQISEKTEAAKIAKIAGVDYTDGMVFTITAPKNVIGRLCECGCGQKTSGGLWMPGHDAKHKSRLFQLVRSGDPTQVELATAELKRRDWPLPTGRNTQPVKPLEVPAEQ